MTNQELIKEWRDFGIEFKSTKEWTALASMFVICCGETKIDVDGKDELVVVFYQGFYEKGSPAVMFNSDDKNNCWTFGKDNTRNTHIKSKIGKFVKDNTI